MDNNVVYQNTEGRFDPQPSMAFHNFYKWWLVVIGALSLLSAFMSLGSDSGTSISISTFLGAALNISTGICLMKMMNAGRILQTVVNVLKIVGSSVTGLASLLFIFCGGMFGKYLEGSLATLTGGVFAIIGIVLLVGSIASIVISACILKYYGKRKFLFN